MALYSHDEAVIAAIDMVKISLEAGLLQPVIPKGYNDPGDAGKSTAIFLGEMIKELTSQLQKL